jgi:hypothetical protein
MSVEVAARSEIKALPAEIARSTLAVAAIELARRLDGEPSDREAATVARELRLALGELHRLAAAAEPEGEIDVGAAEMGD